MSDIHSVTKEQPSATPPPSTSYGQEQLSGARPLRESVQHLRQKFTTREGWFGSYDYAWLCLPTLPRPGTSKAAGRLPPFFGLNQDIPLFLAAACGLQHALAMLAGLITPPIIFANSLNLDSETQAYMVSASLISCGALDWIALQTEFL